MASSAWLKLKSMRHDWLDSRDTVLDGLVTSKLRYCSQAN
jgi:hypothetical protein